MIKLFIYLFLLFIPRFSKSEHYILSILIVPQYLDFSLCLAFLHVIEQARCESIWCNYSPIIRIRAHRAPERISAVIILTCATQPDSVNVESHSIGV